MRQGKPIDKSLIYKLLTNRQDCRFARRCGPKGAVQDKDRMNNRTYLGELRHKGKWYPGEHAPIVDQKLWGDVQAILATNGRHQGNSRSGAVPAQGDCLRHRWAGAHPLVHAQEKRAAVPLLPAGS